LIGVRVGDHDISKERDCDTNLNGVEVFCTEKYQEYNVSSVHFHPDYSNSTQQNDIALIRLNNSINFTPLSVKPICLPFGSATNLTHNKVSLILYFLFIQFTQSGSIRKKKADKKIFM
jgi:hypothetical protein